MNVTPMDLTILACGIGTFLLRLLPILFNPHHTETTDSFIKAVRGMMNAIGPAAITSLLVVSIWPPEHAGLDPQYLGALAAGLLSVYLTRRTLGGITLPTLTGALVYGLCLQW